MLTAELVRVRRKGNWITPAYLCGDAAARATVLAARFIEIVRPLVGRTRGEIDAALDAVDVGTKDRLVAAGLRKLLEDRCTFEVRAPVHPETARRETFLAAAEAYGALDVKDELDRGAVLARVAAALGASVEDVEASLYADLHDSEVLASFDALSAAELVARYNLALAQALLLRAVRVRVTVGAESPARLRTLFSAARFHGLLHVVRATGPSTWEIALDGPLSMFESVQRYGVKLAAFLPHVVKCSFFQLLADVRWGPRREERVAAVTSEDGLVSHVPDPPSTLPDMERLRRGFEALGSEWSVRPSDRIFALPGEVVVIPDLVFENRETGEQVFLEAFGFWSRKAVWDRIELLRKGFPARILLAVAKKLRVSEEVLDEGAAGELYVYASIPSPRVVLDRLRRRAQGA